MPVSESPSPEMISRLSGCQVGAALAVAGAGAGVAEVVLLAGAAGVGGACAVAGDGSGCAQARPAHASVSSSAPASSHLDLLRIGLPFEVIKRQTLRFDPWLNA